MAHFSFPVMTMSQDVNQLRQLLGPVIDALGYELVGVELHPQRGQALLRVYIDKESGIDLADCQQVSHQISGVLDVADPLPGRYTLEVSSPGLDRPLFEAAHFARFAGHQVRLQLTAPLNGQKKLRGRIVGVRDADVVLESAGAELRVPLESIEKARLIPEF